MAPTAEELLTLAVEQIRDTVPDGDLPAATLARRIGLPYQRVYRWFQPGNGPDYEGALAILEAFGWLSIPADARTAAGIAPDPLERIAVGVTELLRDQKKILRRLPAAQPEPRQSPGPAQTKPKKAAKK